MTKIKKKSSSLLLSALCGTLTSGLTMFLMSAILSSLSLKFRNPIDYSAIMSVASVAVGGIIGGITAGSSYKDKPLLAATLSAAVIAAILLFTCAVSEQTFTLKSLISPAIMLISSVVGEYIRESISGKRRKNKYVRR